MRYAEDGVEEAKLFGRSYTPDGLQKKAEVLGVRDGAVTPCIDARGHVSRALGQTATTKSHTAHRSTLCPQPNDAPKHTKAASAPPASPGAPRT